MSVPVVYDTMIFIQGAARPERTHATFRAVRDGRVTLCISDGLLFEIREVLARPRVQAKFPGFTASIVNEFFADISLRAKLIEPVPHVFTWPEHPDDDHIFNLAIAAKARYLVTWENRLLNILRRPTPPADSLRALAPQLEVITPKALSEELHKNADRPQE